MVGWSRRARERAQREARAQACVDAGCKCYCHRYAPLNRSQRFVNDHPIVSLILFAVFYTGFWAVLAWMKHGK